MKIEMDGVAEYMADGNNFYSPFCRHIILDSWATLNDTITATLNTETNVPVVQGFDGSYLPNILDILNVGNYHEAEQWLSSECLRKNIRLRKRAFHRNKSGDVH